MANLNPVVFINDFDLTTKEGINAALPNRTPTGNAIRSEGLPRSSPLVHLPSYDLRARITEVQVAVQSDNARAKRVDVEDVAKSNDIAQKRFRQNKCSGEMIDNTKAFVVVGLLEEREAEYVMSVASPHLKPLDTLYAQRTRMADRAMIRSPKVAQQLYHRLLPYLKKEDYAERSPLCFGQDGVWVPLGLNDCLKVFRYSPGGLFVEHRDGPWVPRQDQCSMFTVVVYLNDDFEGGETELMGSSEFCSPGGYIEMIEHKYVGTKLVLNITPVTGMALLLNHDCWHCATPVVEGTKWILRTELIFQRVHNFYVDKNAFASSEDYLATRALYDASMQASNDGDREVFFSSYQEVVRRQREAMLRAEACRKPRLLAALGLEELSVILSHLRDSEIASLLRLNRRTHIAVVQAPYWQDRYEASLRSAGPAVPKLLGPNLLSSLHWFRDHLTGSSETTNTSHTHGDYFGLVRQRLWLKRQFIPAGLILLDSGSVIAIPHPKPKVLEHCIYEDARRPTFEHINSNIAPSKRSVVLLSETQNIEEPRHKEDGQYALYRSKKLYGNRVFSTPYHMNRPRGESYDLTDNYTKFDDFDFVIDFSNGKVAEVEWSILTPPVEQLVATTETPIVVVCHLGWFSKIKDDAQRNLLTHAQIALDALFNLSRFPAVAFCHPAVCATVGFLATSPDLSQLSDPDCIIVEMNLDMEDYYFKVSMSTYNVEECDSCESNLRLLDCTDDVSTEKQTPSQVVMRIAHIMGLGVQVMLNSPSITECFIYRY